MSAWWAAQIDNLEGTAEIFCKLTSATEGGASTHASYKQFRGFSSTGSLRSRPSHCHPILPGEKGRALCARSYAYGSRWRSGPSLFRAYRSVPKQIAQDCWLLFDNSASVHQVACSNYKMGQLGVFRLYIKFDLPPDPHVAKKVLARICVRQCREQCTPLYN